MTQENKKARGPTDDTSFNVCGVCGDEHNCGFGFTPGGFNNPIMWCCTECLEIAPHVYGVIRVKGNLYSKEARDQAGIAGGAYLDKIGKTDMGDLTEDEWREFLDVLFRTRTEWLRRLYAGHVPTLDAPF